MNAKEFLFYFFASLIIYLVFDNIICVFVFIILCYIVKEINKIVFSVFTIYVIYKLLIFFEFNTAAEIFKYIKSFSLI